MIALAEETVEGYEVFEFPAYNIGVSVFEEGMHAVVTGKNVPLPVYDEGRHGKDIERTENF